MFGSKRILGGATSPSRHMAIAVALTGALLLGACGQRGPLYLPQKPANGKPAAEKPADAAPRTAPDLPAQR